FGYPAITEGIQHTLYKWLLLPLVVLSGLLFAIRRNTKSDDHDDSESAKGEQS
ncbi:MAG: hydrogenase 2 protein HybA, partial [Gammaproteobacteria bacterium]